MSLVEERLGEAGMLTQTGTACLWRILGLRAGLPLNHLCRLGRSLRNILRQALWDAARLSVMCVVSSDSQLR